MASETIGAPKREGKKVGGMRGVVDMGKEERRQLGEEVQVVAVILRSRCC